MSAPRFHPFARLFFCALGLVAVAVAVSFMLFIGSALATAWTGRPPSEQLGDIAIRYALPLTLLSYPANLLWIALCRTSFDRCSFASLGLRARRAFPDMMRGALAGALAIGVLWSILWLTGAISVVGWSPEAFELGWDRVAISLLGYGLVFLAVGFFEETLFRGYALHNFNNWLGWKGGVAAQAVIFGLVHLGNVANADSQKQREAMLAALGALPSLILIAVFFALCYRKTGSLWFPIGFHFAWNFCLGCVFSLPVSGISTFRLLDVQSNQSSWLSGGSFGAEGSFLLLPILGLLIYYISRSADHPQALLDLGLLARVEVAPTPAPVPLPQVEEETESERENRFRTKFGSAQGFSADTLRELRELQEQREAAAREAAEAAEKETPISSMGVSPVGSSGPATSVVLKDVAPVLQESPSEPNFQSGRAETRTVPVPPVIEAETEESVVTPPTIPAQVIPTVTAPNSVPAPRPATPPSAPVPNPAPTPEKKKPSPRW